MLFPAISQYLILNTHNRL